MADLTFGLTCDEEVETLICELHREDECVMPLSNWRVSIPGDRTLNARLVGISRFDLRIRSALPIKATPGMEFEISTPFGQHSCVVSGDIHWSQRDGDEWEFGIFLTSEVPPQVFQRNPRDRRRSLRYPSEARGLLTWDDQDQEIRCFVVNYSSDGFSLVSPTQGRVGNGFTFRWAANGSTNSVSGTAMWQFERQNHFVLGCSLPDHQGRQFSPQAHRLQCLQTDD